MATKTQSRYQVGLSYDPAMATTAYLPERGAGGQTDIGDYTVTPIPFPGGTGGGVTAPATQGGSGLGGAGLGVSALGALANPNVLSALRNGYNLLTKPSGGDALMQEAVHQSALDGLGSQGGLANMADGWLAGEGVGSGGLTSLGGGSFSGTSAGGGLDYLGAGADQADKIGSLFGSGDGGSGIGSWLGSLQGTAYNTGATGLDGVMSSGLLGGGFDLAGAAGTLGAGAFGNWVASQAGYNGNRDPAGSQIGAGLGSAVGGLFLGPIGAFIGAQFGGAIGGQFGPEQTIGPHWDSMANYTPGGGGWSYGDAADNGAAVHNGASQDFYNALIQYAQGQGYSVNPNATNPLGFQIGYADGGEGTRSFGSGYYYRPSMFASLYGAPGETPYGQYWFGNDLNAPYQGTASGMGGFGIGIGGGGAGNNMLPQTNSPDPALQYTDAQRTLAPGATNSDAMLQFAFNDLLNGGYFMAPDGSVRTASLPGTSGAPTEQSQG